MAMMRRTVAAALWKGIKSCMQQREVVGSYSSSSPGFFVLLENQSLVVKRTREFGFRLLGSTTSAFGVDGDCLSYKWR
jgi:hypothetical protein